MAWGFLEKAWGGFKKPKPLATSEDLTHVVFELLKSHGLPCKLQNGWVVAKNGCLSAQGRVFINNETDKGCVVVLDFEFRTPQGLCIVEAFAGLGATRHAAIGEGVLNFCNGSFHVLFSALTGGTCEHCEVEDWEIGGRLRRVFLGPAVIRGTLPTGDFTAGQWYLEMKGHLERCELPEGTHWVRYYHGQGAGLEPQNEALLDNEPETGLQNQLAALPWPESNPFYSLRTFFIITDLNDR